MKRGHSTPRPEDEYFRTEAGAKVGVPYKNTSETGPRVVLPCFGPDVKSGRAGHGGVSEEQVLRSQFATLNARQNRP